MISLAEQTLKNAYVPRCHFPVAACLRTPEGHFFSGCNFENASYSLSLCAETAAIASMISAGYQKIHSMVIMAEKAHICSPCGACRQRISEFSTPTTLIYLYGNGIIQKSLTVLELLPHPFVFEPPLVK